MVITFDQYVFSSPTRDFMEVEESIFKLKNYEISMINYNELKCKNYTLLIIEECNLFL